MAGDVRLSDYNIVDLILGRQKTTITGNGNTGIRYSAFPARLQKELSDYTHRGGDLMVSGEYVVSDLLDSRASHGSTDFAEKTLGVSKGEGAFSLTGKVRLNGRLGKADDIAFSNTLNERQYIVQRPDILVPSQNMDSEIFLMFPDTGEAAGVMTKKGKSRGVVMSIPFESITEEADRFSLMREILGYLGK